MPLSTLALTSFFELKNTRSLIPSFYFPAIPGIFNLHSHCIGNCPLGREHQVNVFDDLLAILDHAISNPW